MAQTLESYGKHYASMRDEDLQRLAGDIPSLVPTAREALKLELQRRSMVVEGTDWTAPPAPAVLNSGGAFRRLPRNLLIFLGSGIGCSFLQEVSRSGLQGIDLATLVISLEGAFRPGCIILGVLTGIRFGTRRTARARSVGAIVQLALTLIFAIGFFVNLEPVSAKVLWSVAVAWVIYGLWQDWTRKDAAEGVAPA
jgi:hypothetical protein